jgi:hypothetical protein
MINRRMVDPLETFIIEDRIKQASGLVLLLLAACALAYLKFSTVVTNGGVVKAEVLHVGMYPAGRLAGGDLPILTVRLPDGSTRVVRATWQDVDHCAPGRWISLLQNGTALQVGVPGCNAAH